jgi:hypothetical protein
VVNGIDGRDQNVPIGTLVDGNQASELGVYTKQAGFYYHAQSIAATVTRNVFFNIPRAGININDGYGGGHLIDQNCAFNNVRETVRLRAATLAALGRRSPITEQIITAAYPLKSHPPTDYPFPLLRPLTPPASRFAV